MRSYIKNFFFVYILLLIPASVFAGTGTELFPVISSSGTVTLTSGLPSGVMYGYRDFSHAYDGNVNNGPYPYGATGGNSWSAMLGGSSTMEGGWANGGVSTSDGTYWVAVTNQGSPYSPNWSADYYYWRAVRSGGVWSAPIIPISSNITSTTTWSGPLAYVISGDISINSGVTLIIQPGTVVKFSTSTPSSITVNGTLNSIGGVSSSTANNHIFLTSRNDSGYNPNPGDWGGIIVNSGGVSNIAYTTIRYGGNATSSNALIYNNGGTVNIASSTIAYSNIYGVKNLAGTTTITSSDVAFNDYGLYLSGGGLGITASSTIHDNASYGIYNNTTNTINAENNWWATPTGPYYSVSNPSGEGDIVSDYIDFDPFLQSLHYVSGVSSVDSGEIRWDGSTSHMNEWYNSIAVWNALGSINIATDTAFTITDVTVSDVNQADKVWVGLWDFGPSPNTIKINNYYAQYYTSNQIQNVITHELGHALGLNHSYLGNIMYSHQTPQTFLGSQDVYDYYYLWQ